MQLTPCPLCLKNTVSITFVDYTSPTLDKKGQHIVIPNFEVFECSHCQSDWCTGKECDRIQEEVNKLRE